MGLRTLDVGHIIGRPREKSGKNSADGFKECPDCGETTRAAVCAACSETGKGLAELFKTYEKERFIPGSPIIDDIYTVLGMKGVEGELTIGGLAKEVIITSEHLEHYTTKLAQRGSIIVDTRRNKRGQDQTFVKLTSMGRTASRSFRTLQDFERDFGHLPYTDVQTPEKKKSRGRNRKKAG